jgi:hypothetical protein
LAPRLDFNLLRALRQHIVRALRQLTCPQSLIHGWSGLAITPAMYLLLEPQPLVEPVNPGDTAIYPPFSPPSTIKMIDAAFTRDKNYFPFLRDINRACFKMLDDLISNQFKVSNTPNLTGWNSTMTLLEILKQLKTLYRKPDTMTLFGNDTLFRSPFPANEAPEMLFYRIGQCQEIQILAQDPYSPTQIINNAVRLLQQSGIFPLKEFDTWDAITPKTYPALKTFIHEAYTHRLMALQLRNTTGTQGYAPNNNQNMYNVLDQGFDTDSGTKGTVAMQTAPITQTMAMTTGSTLGSTYSGGTIQSEIFNAINQLVANQQSIMTQMAAMSFNNAPTPSPQAAATFHIPPIQQLNIPTFAGQTNIGYNASTRYNGEIRGRGGGRGRGRGGSRDGGGRGARTPFVNHLQNTQMAAGHGGMAYPGIGYPPPVGGFNGKVAKPPNPPHSNIVKMYANWNVCFLCGFDIEEGHTSQTCPAHWCKMNHQEGFTRKNSRQWINAGYGPCTKGMHKLQFPSF